MHNKFNQRRKGGRLRRAMGAGQPGGAPFSTTMEGLWVAPKMAEEAHMRAVTAVTTSFTALACFIHKGSDGESHQTGPKQLKLLCLILSNLYQFTLRLNPLAGSRGESISLSPSAGGRASPYSGSFQTFHVRSSTLETPRVWIPRLKHFSRFSDSSLFKVKPLR